VRAANRGVDVMVVADKNTVHHMAQIHNGTGSYTKRTSLGTLRNPASNALITSE